MKHTVVCLWQRQYRSVCSR